MLSKIHGLSGIKSKIDPFAAEDIQKMISSYFKTLSLEEIYKAFELERFGLYEAKTDHFQLFDANYVSEILKKYKNWKINEKRALNISAPKMEVEVDKESIRNEYLKTIFSEIASDGFSSGAYGLYKQLEKQINASDEQKKKLYHEQLKVYEVEEKAYISNRGISVKTLLGELKRKIEDKAGVDVVKNKCKSILVSDYLKKYCKDFEYFKNQIR